MTCLLLDTNVWVFAFLAPGGHCGHLVHRLLGAAAMDVVVSTPLVDELADVLARPRLLRRYGFIAGEAHEYIEWIWSVARLEGSTSRVRPDRPAGHHLSPSDSRWPSSPRASGSSSRS